MRTCMGFKIWPSPLESKATESGPMAGSHNVDGPTESANAMKVALVYRNSPSGYRYFTDYFTVITGNTAKTVHICFNCRFKLLRAVIDR